ncbi:hypothetical protein SAMN04488057_11149 [Cyclobacterium lianum]|uniref:TPR repeat-containing protein n=1 Tax=Cyclobacterium lianum TaxID=388280 RepID=A0A1M7PWE6_9BACT|nr:hypothetical protein [Cyclobacterium lianum]SHN21826.1 hypothetical protein SAMN04488057_11149 [Cyclobacterium lianum]
MIVIKKSVAVNVLFAVFIFYSCNQAQVIKKADNQKIEIHPNTLERLGDSVRFSLEVRLPNASLRKNEVYTLRPVYVFGNEKHTFTNSIQVSGDTLDPHESIELKGNFSMPFTEGMEKGTMYAQSAISRKNQEIAGRVPETVLTHGIITTASMAQIGQYRGQESLPVLGALISIDSEESMGMLADGWQALEDRLAGYSNLPYAEKAPFLEVLKGPGDWTYKKKQMEGLPHYPIVERDVLSRFETLFGRQLATRDAGVSEIQRAILARNIRQGTVPADTLTEVGLAIAASKEPGWTEQEALLRAMEEVYPSAYVYNNLGVVFLNLANRVTDVKMKNQYLENALFALNRSNAIFENPHAVYNLGVVFWLWEDKFSAYNNFYRALALTRSDRLTKRYEAALGAVSIFNGDYRLAAIHLNKAVQNPVNLFNQGLANLLAKDYYNATVKFEESAIQNMSNGFPFYGLALVAARNGEVDKLYENLRKAVSRSEYLRQRALVDREFGLYHEQQRFKDILRSQSLADHE